VLKVVSAIPTSASVNGIVSWWIFISLAAASFAVATVLIGEPIQLAVTKKADA